MVPNKIESIYPINDRILIEFDEWEDKTPGGIVIPDNARDRKEKPKRGTVLKLGHGVIENGKLRPFRVNPGDRVYFTLYGGSTLDIEGKHYIFCLESELVGYMPASVAVGEKN